MLTDAKYAELFPSTSYNPESQCPLFGEYAQLWLNGRKIVKGTRRNYRASLNRFWMPALATKPLDKITTFELRKLIGSTEWASPSQERTAIQHLRTMFASVVADGILSRNPAGSLELPKLGKKVIDPFEREEADQIIEWMYANLTGSLGIYACYFEFAFYTGMRPGEIIALRWDEVDTRSKVARVCRIMADGEIHERTKTGVHRDVLLNARALHALDKAREVATLRAKQRRQFPDSPYIFPPTKNFEFIQQASVTDKHFRAALVACGIRRRPQYNCRHTYASMCLTAGMKPGFVANQLGHSVQMLLSRYARWMESRADWDELAKLDTKTAPEAAPTTEQNASAEVRVLGPIGTKLVH